MPNRYSNEHDYRRGQDRPRDEYGRFESESEHQRGFSSQDRPRDEYGRFESGYDQRRGQDRPRDEYGRFESESDRGRSGGRQGYYSGSESYLSRQGRRDEDRGENDYGNRGWEGRSHWGSSLGNDYNDRPYERSMERFSQMGSGSGSYRGEDEEWESSRRYGERQNRSGEMGIGARSPYAGNWSSERQQGSPSGRGEQSHYVGRGPKGYRRPDERIEEDVNEALTDSPDLDASEIEVKVSNGEVILSGTVTERSAKRTAEDIAERCSGVKDVRNEIRVQRESDSGTNGQSQLRGKSASGAGAKTQESKSA